MNDNSLATTAPLETMTKNRVYVTVANKKNEPKYITYFDKENKRFKQIDLSGNIHVTAKRKIAPPHTHLGYEHDEKGTHFDAVRFSRALSNATLRGLDYTHAADNWLTANQKRYGYRYTSKGYVNPSRSRKA